MKKTTILFICLSVMLFAVSCSNEDNNNNGINPKLEGTWHLIERYVSPGAGDVNFSKVTSAKTYVFKNNLQITSNGSLWNNDIDAVKSSTGSYIITSESTNPIISGIITPSERDITGAIIKISYKLEESYLYVFYPSIEGSIAKYEKIK